jgi:hypothetical protein
LGDPPEDDGRQAGLDDRIAISGDCREAAAARQAVAQEKQCHGLIGEERADHPQGQPARQRLLHQLLDHPAGEEEDQLIGNQQDGQGHRHHAHAHQLAEGDFRGQSAFEVKIGGWVAHRRRA